MISVLTIGSLYWSSQPPINRETGIQQCTTNYPVPDAHHLPLIPVLANLPQGELRAVRQCHRALVSLENSFQMQLHSSFMDWRGRQKLTAQQLLSIDFLRPTSIWWVPLFWRELAAADWGWWRHQQRPLHCFEADNHWSETSVIRENTTSGVFDW